MRYGKTGHRYKISDAFLLPFGYGDGGGGPSRDYVEYALRQKDLEGGVKVKMEGPKEFFEECRNRAAPNTPMWVNCISAHTGNLYLSGYGKEK